MNSGRFTKTICRYHSEVTPSCVLDWKDLTFHCYGCSAEGKFRLDEDGKPLFLRTNAEEES